ncbi:MAG: Asr1405/Asl0597 family protein, partial [Cyanobacteria bacterium P01_H01_bin.121]
QILTEQRWPIYFRLQALEIACQCQGYKPLRVEVSTVQDAIQVWAVVQQCMKPRRELAAWLDRCLDLD